MSSVTGALASYEQRSRRSASPPPPPSSAHAKAADSAAAYVKACFAYPKYSTPAVVYKPGPSHAASTSPPPPAVASGGGAVVVDGSNAVCDAGSSASIYSLVLIPPLFAFGRTIRSPRTIYTVAAVATTKPTTQPGQQPSEYGQAEGVQNTATILHTSPAPTLSSNSRSTNDWAKKGLMCLRAKAAYHRTASRQPRAPSSRLARGAYRYVHRANDALDLPSAHRGLERDQVEER
jgi:hypothetical protein